jgi:hypothetical protein
MAFTQSPNMNLIIPTVGAEPGPTYAADINNDLTLVDQHDHSPGKGVQITPAGLNINASLNIQGNALSNVGSVILANQTSGDTTLQSLYAAPGGETPTATADLWYTDSNGIAIQITQAGIVKTTALSIPGESYSGGTFFWTQTQSSLPLTPANFSIGSILLQPNTASTSKGVLLGPPSSPAASVQDIQLPLVPTGNTAFMTMDTSGDMLTNVSTVNGITRQNLVPVGQQISASCGNFSTNNSIPGGVTNLSVTITTTGRPVMVLIQPDGTGNSSSFYLSAGGTTTLLSGNIFIIRDSTTTLVATNLQADFISTTGPSYSFPATLTYLDTPSAGTHTYIVEANTTSTVLGITYCVLVAYEL